MNEQISHHELKSCPGCATLDVLTRKSPDFIIFKARHKRQILLSYFFHSSWPLTTLPLLGSGWDLLFPSCWTKMLWWEIWKNPLFSPSPSVRILSSATQPPPPPKMLTTSNVCLLEIQWNRILSLFIAQVKMYWTTRALRLLFYWAVKKIWFYSRETFDVITLSLSASAEKWFARIFQVKCPLHFPSVPHHFTHHRKSTRVSGGLCLYSALAQVLDKCWLFPSSPSHYSI